MGLTINVAKLLLPLTALAFAFGGPKLAFENGFFKILENAVKAHKLPGSSDTLRTHWTGFEPVDGLLSTMVCFFYPLVDGKNPGLSLLALHFTGQLSSIWLLMCVESFRVGNAWRLISCITIIGLSVENMGAGLVIPLYCLLHLLTSPTARAPGAIPRATRKASLLIHPSELRVLPWSTALGHFVPAVLSLYMSKTTLTPFWASGQFWILARLLHPLWTAIIHVFLSMTLRAGEPAFASADQRNREVRRTLSGVYTYAMFVAAVPHLITTTLCVGSYIFPSLFSLSAQAAFHPSTLLRPVYFWDSAKFQTTNAVTGAFDFLQWDEVTAIAAPLIWAFALNRQSLSNEPTGSSFIYTVFKTLLMTLVGGPAAAAISLIKERDEVVLDLPDVLEEKRLM